VAATLELSRRLERGVRPHCYRRMSRL
jgi:hypothetical protein